MFPGCLQDVINRHQPSRPAAETWRLTRRSFLALCLAGCSQLARRPVPEASGLQTWALISDTHISSSRERSVRGSCMADNLERVVADLVSAGPDHVLVNGDLALATGEQADYAMFQELVSPLRSRGIPPHVTPGNHDHRDRLVESFAATTGAALPADPAVPGKLVSGRVIGGVQWILLDSLEWINTIPGRLGPEQRQWLARKIDSNPAPAIVCLHHNPKRSPTGLEDADELLGILLPRRRVKLVLFGHTHEFRVWRTDGLHFVNLPACGYPLLLKPNVSLGWVRTGIGQGGASLEFRGVTARERDHGTTLDLPWRGDA